MVSQHPRLVSLAEIVCQSRDGDRVLISKRRSCVDLGAVLDSLVFNSDLKNLHQGGECREGIKNRDDRVFKLIDRFPID